MAKGDNEKWRQKQRDELTRKIKVGSRVFSIHYGLATVEKINQKTLNLRFKDGGVLLVDKAYCMLPEEWTARGGTLRKPGNRSITGQGRTDIYYITRSGRVIPAKDMKATLYRVTPSGRTIRLPDKKPGNIPKDGTTRQKVTVYVYNNEGWAIGNRKHVVFIDSPGFGHLKDGRQVVKMGSNWYT